MTKPYPIIKRRFISTIQITSFAIFEREELLRFLLGEYVAYGTRFASQLDSFARSGNRGIQTMDRGPARGDRIIQ